MMRILLFIILISKSNSYFTGCPMDGCESTLSNFVDLTIDGFHENVKWRRIDLLKNDSRGCVSNGLSSIICVVDSGYASFNITNGELLWLIAIQTSEETETASLPIVNYEGFLIISNNTDSMLVNHDGKIQGVFNYEPILIPPLAGPFVTDDGQIIVADLVSVSCTFDTLFF